MWTSTGHGTIEAAGLRAPIFPRVKGRTILRPMDWKLELVTLPVSDVDRAKEFYVDKVGFNADHDVRPVEGIRFVQLTPPGSACSVAIGEGLTEAPPGTAPNLMVVVSDIQAAHARLKDKGVDVSDVDVQEWGHFVYFADPDGNKWAVQQLVPPPSETAP